MSSSPTTKAAEKEHKDNKVILAHFEGKLSGKKNGLQIDFKLSGWMSYPNSLMELFLVRKKVLPSHPYLKQKLIYVTF